jgi:hypothetical protein
MWLLRLAATSTRPAMHGPVRETRGEIRLVSKTTGRRMTDVASTANLLESLGLEILMVG